VEPELTTAAGRLARINELEGITLATLAAHSPVRPRQIVGTVKIIPFAVPEAAVRAAEAIAGDAPLIRVDALAPQPVSLIFSGSVSIREKLADDFAPLAERVTALGSRIASTDYVPLEDESGEAMLAELLRQRASGARLIVLAGETAIMDRHDIVPRAIERAGGRVECLGAPVDPGNLLMIAYLGEVPILGAPVLSFPLSDERKSGWLPPSVNIDNKSGLELAVPWYWNIAPQRDATLTPIVYSRRGFGLDSEVRYLAPAHRGEVEWHWLPNDRVVGDSREG
jgi:hypothetical protein